MSTSMAPSKLMFSLWAGETCARTSSSTQRPERRSDFTASPSSCGDGLEAIVLAEAERVTVGIDHDPHLFLRLIGG